MAESDVLWWWTSQHERGMQCQSCKPHQWYANDMARTGICIAGICQSQDGALIASARSSVSGVGSPARHLRAHCVWYELLQYAKAGWHVAKKRRGVHMKKNVFVSLNTFFSFEYLAIWAGSWTWERVLPHELLVLVLVILLCALLNYETGSTLLLCDKTARPV